ncbi:MAG: DUF6562 domain-containing protein, partial [Alistipes sp.]|nr:DUF6562 domain-containing protein [Alistipes sp.]
ADDGDKQYGNDSAFGAIDYLSDDANQYRTDWSDVNLRYTLEVYDVDGLTATPIKDRQVIIVDEYEPVKFDLRLVPNRDYQFVVFADFVPQTFTDVTVTDAVQSEAGLHHTIGSTLQSITIKNDAINDECTDAYFVSEKIKIENSAPKSITLKRPYGKVRVIATDLAELNLNVDPASVEVKYTAIHPQTFNAVLGTIGAEEQEKVYALSSAYNEGVSKVSLANHFYTEGYDKETKTNAKGDVRHTHMTLFTDYILAVDNEQRPINFEMSVYEESGELIKTTEFSTMIPVQRNSLTTIIGNVLTTATEINITIDDNFDSEYTYQLWDGKSIKEPQKEGEFYVIYEAAELAWLADQVNNKGQKFAGKTFKLGKDIHLNHELWTPIGATGKFEGTFDGRYKDVDHKLEGVFVSVEGKTAAGLFANAKYVRNLTVLNSQIYGQYKTGVIVGDGLCSRIDNCHVDGCEVLVTPYNQDEANNVGGIVGYLSAENEAWVKNCSVKNTKITAYRKVGGIAGAANQAAVVTGNSVENVTVIADMTSDYKEPKAADAGAFVGYVHAKATVSNNTRGADVSVTVFIDTNGERDAYVAKNDEVIHVTFKAGEYNFSKDLFVNGAVQANRGGEVVLNVNGQTITSGTSGTSGTSDTVGHYGFIAKGEGNTLVVNDAVVVSNGGGFAAAEGAKIIFNGKSIAVNTTNTSGRYHFYTSTGGQIEINGGTFNLNTSKKRAYVYANAGTRVVINGGVFGKPSTRSDYKAGIMGPGTVIIYGGTFGFDPSKWVAPGYFTVKEGANWVVKAPVVVNNESELAEAVANAVEGTQIILTDNVNYGTITAGELKNVTINGGENTVMTFVTDANSKLENVTLNNVDFVYDGSNVNSGIVIDAEATIKNLVIDGCSFVGTGAKAGRGLSGNNNSATIEVKNCSFSNIGYPIYGWGGYESLTISGCTFENIVSWAIMPQSGFDGNLTVTNNQFSYCKGGLVKAGKLTAGHTFTFTGNVVTNAEPHPNRNWFEFNVSAGNAVISDNTMDGDAWTPGEAQGLK